MHFHCKIILISCMLYKELSEGSLTTTPENAIRVKGENARFRCATDHADDPITPVDWRFKAAESSLEVHIFYGGYLIQKLEDRYSIDTTGDGHYDLVISGVQLEDAGMFSCIDNGGYGKRSDADLLVLVNAPVCKTNFVDEIKIGDNECGLQVEYINLTCSTSFKGVKPPTMQWKYAHDGKKVNSGIVHFTVINSLSESTINSTLHLPTVGVPVGSQYIFDVTNHSWTSPPVTQFSLVADDNPRDVCGEEKVRCSTYAYPECSYHWVNEDQVTVSNKHELNLKTLNRSSFVFRCVAECQIREKFCDVTLRTVRCGNTVTILSSTHQDVSVFWWMSIPIAASLVFIIIIAFLFCWIKRIGSSRVSENCKRSDDEASSITTKNTNSSDEERPLQQQDKETNDDQNRTTDTKCNDTEHALYVHKNPPDIGLRRRIIPDDNMAEENRKPLNEPFQHDHDVEKLSIRANNEDSFRHLDEELSKLQELCRHKDAEIEQLRKEQVKQNIMLQQQVQDLDSKTAKIEDLELSDTEQNEEITELSSRVRLLEKEIQEKEETRCQDIARTDEKRGEFEAKIEELQTRIDETETQQLLETSKVAELQEKLNSTEETLQDLQKETANQVSRHQEVLSEIIDGVNLLQKTNENNERVCVERGRQPSMTDSDKEEQLIAKRQNEVTEKKIPDEDEGEDEINSETVASQLHEQLLKLVKVSESQNELLLEQSADIEAMRNALLEEQERVKVSNEEKGKFVKEQSVLRERNEKLQQRVRDLLATAKSESDLSEEQQHEIERLTSELSSTHNDNENERQLHDETRARVTELQTQLLEQEGNHENRREENSELKQKIRELEEKQKKTESDLEEEREKLAKEHQTSRQMSQQLQLQYTYLNAAVQKLFGDPTLSYFRCLQPEPWQLLDHSHPSFFSPQTSNVSDSASSDGGEPSSLIPSPDASTEEDREAILQDLFNIVSGKASGETQGPVSSTPGGASTPTPTHTARPTEMRKCPKCGAVFNADEELQAHIDECATKD